MRLTRQGMDIVGLTWSRDGRFIVYDSIEGSDAFLWRVQADASRPPERIELAGLSAALPATARTQDRLALARSQTDIDIYRHKEGGAHGPLPASPSVDTDAQFSPDGRRIAFTSGRAGGGNEIWLAAADGSNLEQPAHGPGRQQGSPRRSPDGRRIVFYSWGEDGQWHVWIMDVEGGAPRRLTTDAANENVPRTTIWSCVTTLTAISIRRLAGPA